MTQTSSSVPVPIAAGPGRFARYAEPKTPDHLAGHEKSQRMISSWSIPKELTKKKSPGCSSDGRATCQGQEGRWFKSTHPDDGTHHSPDVLSLEVWEYLATRCVPPQTHRPSPNLAMARRSQLDTFERILAAAMLSWPLPPTQGLVRDSPFRTIWSDAGRTHDRPARFNDEAGFSLFWYN